MNNRPSDSLQQLIDAAFLIIALAFAFVIPFIAFNTYTYGPSQASLLAPFFGVLLFVWRELRLMRAEFAAVRDKVNPAPPPSAPPQEYERPTTSSNILFAVLLVGLAMIVLFAVTR